MKKPSIYDDHQLSKATLTAKRKTPDTSPQTKKGGERPLTPAQQPKKGGGKKPLNKKNLTLKPARVKDHHTMNSPSYLATCLKN